MGGIGKLEVGLLASTAIACLEPAAANQESEYYSALGRVSSYTVTNDSLVFSGSKASLVYEPLM